MSTKRFKQILPTSKFALSTEEDTYTSVPLDGDMREIPEVETDENVLADEVFENEREKGTKYRISAQLDMTVLVNDPYIGFNGLPTADPYQSLTNPTAWCAANDDLSDPINGGASNYGENDIYPLLNNKNSEDNWFTKVLYPESYMPNDTQIGFSKLITAPSRKIYIQDGLPIIGVEFVVISDVMYPCFVTETDVKLQPDDYVYINPLYFNTNNTTTINEGVKLAKNMSEFQRVITTTLNPVDLDITIDGFLPADTKLFVIDYPMVNPNKPNSSAFTNLNPTEQDFLLNLSNFRFIGSYKRVIGVSKDDIDNNTTITSTSVTSINNGQQTKVTVSNPHGLSKGFYVEMPYTGGSLVNDDFTGIFRIDSIVDDNNFIIDANINTVNNNTSVTYKVVDAIASDYMIRVFKELTDINDYVIDKTAFAENIYKDGTFLINFIKDVDTNGLTDYLGRPLSELFVGIIKRAGSKDYDWAPVVSHFSHIIRGQEGNTDTGLGDPGSSPIPGVLPVTSYGGALVAGKTTEPLENTYGISDYPSKRQGGDNIVIVQNEITSVDYHYGTDTTSDGKYLGDLVEYNRGELSERVISDIYHRFNTTWRAFGYYNGCDGFAGAYEGMYYKPFHRYQIKKWADAVEAATPPAAQPDDPFSAYTEAIQFEGVPTYAEEVQGLKIWRDLLGPGNFDSVGGLDYPFLNGGHYLYNNIKITLRRQTPGRSGFDLRVIDPNFLPSRTTYIPDESC